MPRSLALHTLVVMDAVIISVILALGVSADALACGYGAGASKIKIPLTSAAAAGAVSAFCVLAGMLAADEFAKILPERIVGYLSAGVLAVFGLIKIGSGGGTALPDTDCDRRLGAGEGVSLGAAISLDGLAAGIGCGAGVVMTASAAACTFVFTAAALKIGSVAGRCASGGRAGNIAAGLALCVLAVQKLCG